MYGHTSQACKDYWKRRIKRIEDLTREAETLNIFAHYFQNVEVKQIEASEAKKLGGNSGNIWNSASD